MTTATAGTAEETRGREMPIDQRYCTFWVGGLLFGVGVQKVQEVIRSQVMTPVPLAPQAIGGLINLRGQIVTALDVRTRFGVPVDPEGKPSVNVVIRTDEGPTSLLVDEISDVVDVVGLDLEGPPETLQGGVRAFIEGMYKLDGKLLHVLDSQALIAVED